VCIFRNGESLRSLRQGFMPADTLLNTTRTARPDSPLAPDVFAGSNFGSDFNHSFALLSLDDGAEGTFQTLATMAACVCGKCPPDFSGYQDENNRQAAERIVRNVPSQDTAGEIRALFEFVKDRITYRKHPINQQRVQDCRRTLELRSGDCVSKSVCLATLLATLGYESRFIAQSPDGENFTHVYVEVLTDSGQWQALDPVAENQPMGWTQALPDGGFETPWTIF
jgi:transglutaminase-like putative cysteine protease